MESPLALKNRCLFLTSALSTILRPAKRKKQNVLQAQVWQAAAKEDGNDSSFVSELLALTSRYAVGAKGKERGGSSFFVVPSQISHRVWPRHKISAAAKISGQRIEMYFGLYLNFFQHQKGKQAQFDQIAEARARQEIQFQTQSKQDLQRLQEIAEREQVQIRAFFLLILPQEEFEKQHGVATTEVRPSFFAGQSSVASEVWDTLHQKAF